MAERHAEALKIELAQLRKEHQEKVAEVDLVDRPQEIAHETTHLEAVVIITEEIGPGDGTKATGTPAAQEAYPLVRMPA